MWVLSFIKTLRQLWITVDFIDQDIFDAMTLLWKNYFEQYANKFSQTLSFAPLKSVENFKTPIWLSLSPRGMWKFDVT